jgi:hypothetical protein
MRIIPPERVRGKMAVLRRWLVAAAILVAAPLQAQAADSAQLEPGRRYTQWLYEGQTDSLWARFSPEMRAAIPTAEALATMNEQIKAQVGTETEVLQERIMDPSPEPGMTVYVRSARFSAAPMTIDVMVVTDAAGTIQGLSIRPQRQPDPS